MLSTGDLETTLCKPNPNCSFSSKHKEPDVVCFPGVIRKYIALSVYSNVLYLFWERKISLHIYLTNVIYFLVTE